jgi:hypothetical protein
MKSRLYAFNLQLELDKYGNKNLWISGVDIPICQHDYQGNYTLGNGIKRLFKKLYEYESSDRLNITVNRLVDLVKEYEDSKIDDEFKEAVAKVLQDWTKLI